MDGSTRFLERSLWCLGIASIGIYLLLLGSGEARRMTGVERFEAQQRHTDRALEALRDRSPVAAIADTERQEAAPAASSSVLGVLRIERLRLEVPVEYGSGEDVLSGAAGVIEGSALLGTPGNIAIAAHRDTFFRALEHVVLGDLIQIETLRETRRYRVAELSVVEPTDVEVLEDTGVDQLTLVTCYPFRYFGSAPQRYIVRAVEEHLHRSHASDEEA